MQLLLCVFLSFTLQLFSPSAIDWQGKWMYKDNHTNTTYYTLAVGPKTGTTYSCTLNVETSGNFYLINCTGVERAGSFEIRYNSLVDGHLTTNFQSNELLFSLKQVNNKVVTNWKKWNNATEGFQRL